MPIEYKRNELKHTLNLAYLYEGQVIEDEVLAEMLTEDIV